MYADDTYLSNSGSDPKDIETKMQEDVNKLNDWTKQNGMKLHPKKSTLMVIGTSQ